MKRSVIRELRAVQRYRIRLPVCVKWRSEGASPSPLHTFTRDISTRGMFVEANAAPAEGARLEFEIDLALDEATPLVVVQGEGRVVRTERFGESRAEQRAGFAVHNVWFRMREPEQGQALPVDLTFLGAAPKSSRARHTGLAIVLPQTKSNSRGKK